MILQDFRLLTDENIDHELVEYLRELKFEVFDIKEKELFGMPDHEILALSVSQQSVVVSQDSDFGTLVFRDGHPFFGILLLRPGHASPSFHIQTISAILSSGLDISTPFVLTAENNGKTARIRLRNL